MFRYVVAVFLTFSVVFGYPQGDKDISSAFDADLEEYAKVDYDVLTLAQSWPQTNCWDLNDDWEGATEDSCSACEMPTDKESWTIHGLWPSSLTSTHPSNCNSSYKFDESLLSTSLRAQLEKKWLSFNLEMTNKEFWSYEWKKHGTCALDVDETNTLAKYFSKTVELLDAYNVADILSSANIVPGNEYDSSDVLDALEKALDVNVYIKCTKNTETKEYYLAEIRVCFDKDFNLADCVTGKSTVTCSGKQVIYPEILNSC